MKNYIKEENKKLFVFLFFKVLYILYLGIKKHD